jgi:hypothetical protein
VRVTRQALLVPSLVAALALASGCALSQNQHEAADRFARASAGIGQFSSDELLRLRTTTVEMNTTALKLGAKTLPGPLDGIFSPERVRLRVTAAEALASYGNLLLTLVDASQEAELAAASDKFVGSFNSLAASDAAEGRVPALDAAQSEALGEVVRGIGGLITGWQKAKAVKRIVVETQPAVDQVIVLLIEDFDQKASGLVASFADTTLETLENQSERVMEDGNSGPSARNLAIESMTAITEERARLASVTVQAAAVLAQLQLASAELTSTMNEKASIAQIKQLGGDLKTLAVSARVVAGS